jgi:lipoprotein-anchoring transpeptidase ErfK/SrfK
MRDIRLSRRGFLALGAAASPVFLAGCEALPTDFISLDRGGSAILPEPGPGDVRVEPDISIDEGIGSYASMYAPLYDGGFELPAIPWEKVDRRYRRQIVPDPTGEAPGTLVVDTANHFLYLVRERGEAIRYGVGLGREGFEWAGRAQIKWKKAWPTWTPPAEMIARDPKLAEFSAENGGMPPGLKNPLGARALYIFQGNTDTLYRVHGSPEWWSIGKSVSSGCVRLINQDIIDLYDRVTDGSPILVTSGVAGA